MIGSGRRSAYDPWCEENCGELSVLTHDLLKITGVGIDDEGGRATGMGGDRLIPGAGSPSPVPGG
nr:hypothetical protein GCM10010200_097240 [Actinomadura rugatobispora]